MTIRVEAFLCFAFLFVHYTSVGVLLLLSESKRGSGEIKGKRDFTFCRLILLTNFSILPLHLLLLLLLPPLLLLLPPLLPLLLLSASGKYKSHRGHYFSQRPNTLVEV